MRNTDGSSIFQLEEAIARVCGGKKKVKLRTHTVLYSEVLVRSLGTYDSNILIFTKKNHSFKYLIRCEKNRNKPDSRTQARTDDHYSKYMYY
jgi:hypothetical protein